MRIFLLCLSGIFSGSWQSNLNGWSPLSNYLPRISLPIWRRKRCPCQYFTVVHVFVMVVATVAVSNTHLYVICCHFIWLILLVGILPLWGLINPLSPNIHKEILQTDLYTFPYRISWEKLIKDLRFFSLCDHLINSHRCYTWQSMDIVRRKLMLVTIGT